jgi:hypothetical protein
LGGIKSFKIPPTKSFGWDKIFQNPPDEKFWVG